MIDGGARRRLPSWMLGPGAGAEPPRKSDNGGKKRNVAEEGAAPRPYRTRKKDLDTSAVPQGDDELGGTSLDYSKDEREVAPVRSKTKRQHGKYALPLKSQTLGTSSHGRPKTERQRDKDASGQEDQTLGTSSHDYLKGERKRSKRTLAVEQDAECDVEHASTSEEYDLLGRIVQVYSFTGKTNLTCDGSSGNAEPLAAGINDEELTVEDLLSFAREYLEGEEDEKQQEPSGRQCELERENLKTANGFENSVLHHGSVAGVSARETTINDTSEGVESEQNTASTPMTGDPAQDMLELLLGPLLRKPAEQKKTRTDHEGHNFQK